MAKKTQASICNCRQQQVETIQALETNPDMTQIGFPINPDLTSNRDPHFRDPKHKHVLATPYQSELGRRRKLAANMALSLLNYFVLEMKVG